MYYLIIKIYFKSVKLFDICVMHKLIDLFYDLQISCHGVPWFALTLISIYILRSEGAREVQINLLFGKLLSYKSQLK